MYERVEKSLSKNGNKDGEEDHQGDDSSSSALQDAMEEEIRAIKEDGTLSIYERKKKEDAVTMRFLADDIIGKEKAKRRQQSRSRTGIMRRRCCRYTRQRRGRGGRTMIRSSIVSSC